MEALVYEAPREMVLRRLPMPEPGPGEVRVRVAYSGICGSELSGFLGRSSIRTPPLVFGHEMSGRIEALGDGVEGLVVGQPVTANPLITCGTCPACTTGVEQRCPRRLLLGASLPGCNAELVVVPAASVLPVPDGLDLRQASLVEPAAFALHAVEAAGTSTASAAVVVGAGPIGLLIVQALIAAGSPAPLVAELNPARAAMAERAGASVVDLAEASGADLVFDAVGTEGTRQASFAALAPGGTLMLVGLHTDATSLPLNRAVRDELTVRGVFAYGRRHIEDALDGIEHGRLGLSEGLVEAPLADGQRWYERLVDGDPASKVLLVPGAAA
jgi:2-desacetyl-2-hydroxyethyl bacteriochlorophyllide A dehydrogenase